MVKRLNTIEYGDDIRPGFEGNSNLHITRNVFFTGLEDSSTSSVVYYDTSNGKLSYGASGGGPGGSQTLQEVTDVGNTTSNTVQFTNTDVSIVSSGVIKFTEDILLETDASDDNIRIGNFAGDGTLGVRTVAIGAFSGRDAGDYSIAIGNSAGRVDQGSQSISIGHYSGGGGGSGQGNKAISIGEDAGRVSQGDNTIAIGDNAGYTSQQVHTISIGTNAGEFDQNAFSVAIGYGAGRQYQHANTIVLNASGSELNTSNTNSTVIKPIQSVSFSNVLTYDSATGELGNSEDLNVSNIILNPGLTSIADMSTSTLSIDMEGYSYRTFAVNTAGQNITDLSITNAITGSQGVVFITATTSSCAISKPFATSTYKSGNSALTLPSSNVAALSFVYNGTNFFCNTAEYI